MTFTLNSEEQKEFLRGRSDRRNNRVADPDGNNAYVQGYAREDSRLQKKNDFIEWDSDFSDVINNKVSFGAL